MGKSSVVFHRARALPLLALLFVSAVSVVLVAARIEWTHTWRYLFLVWNLFLAWLPVLFALGVCQRHQGGDRRGWRVCALAGLWILFFPNAPYIFTDLIHLKWWFQPEYWVDFSLVLLVAFTGFLLGFVSLYLMQSVVAAQFGRAASWVFVLAVACMTGFGIYLGRFLRWNSWDVVVHPVQLSHQVGHIAAHPLANPALVVFSALFATFLFFGYLMLYALTHLQAPQVPPAAA
jgi:uncharacterized membrane protein